jgi:hypothetical protein
VALGMVRLHACCLSAPVLLRKPGPGSWHEACFWR